MITPSYITWFKDDEYIGSNISFPSGSTWKFERKIQECEDLNSQDDFEKMKLNSEARAVFICSKISGDGPSTAVIKIHMQVPWYGTANQEPLIRARQAASAKFCRGEREVEALSILTEARCSSAPLLIDWMEREQKNDQWVPGGYILYIVMEKLPGVKVEDLYGRMDRNERDDLRAAFKKAWLECLSCGIIHEDGKSSNLLWDKEKKKCYLLDWEFYGHPPPGKRDSSWRDIEYLEWDLAQVGEAEDYDDMSTWIL